jgi:hypothetical protein
MNKNKLLIPPSHLTLVVTNKCTAACENCCLQCNPKNKDILTLEEMKHYVDSSVAAYNTIKLLVITGGECFMLGKSLDKIIKYASNKGLFVRVVTNGYWATSFDKAYLRLQELLNAGLREFNLSTGDEHQRWVPYNNIVIAIAVALDLNLSVAVNVETSKDSQFDVEQLKCDSQLTKYKDLFDEKLKIVPGIWIPFVKTTKKKSENATKKDKSTIAINQSIGRCSNLFDSIHVYPTNQVYACCGLTIEYIPSLYLGSAKKHSLQFLYEYQFQDFVKIWLFTEGPKKILDFCFIKRELALLDTTGWHICQVCIEIFRDQQNILVLRQNYHEVFSNVIFKYSILRKKYLLNLKTKKL